MPELPEVETVIRSITPKIINRKIANLTVLWNKTLSTHFDYQLKKILYNKIINSVSRRGKYIIFHFDDGFLITHLRMTGKLIFQEKYKKKLSHARFELIFEDKSQLTFSDIRKFGRIGFYKEIDFLNKKLGLEPFSKELTIKYLSNKFRNRNGPIKGTLLNQSIIAGIGNIYADEILFRTNIHPQTPANKLKSKNIKKLISSIKYILNEAINSMGTTIINFSFDKDSFGNYGSKLKVFNRLNKNCKICMDFILKIKCAGRGTYFCPSCQRLN